MRYFLILFLGLSLPVVVFAQELFVRDLYVGMRGDRDVIRLQDFLRDQGHFNYPVSTGNYLDLTSEAVKKFQQARGITPADGNFEILTRSVANGLLSQKKEKPTPSSGAPARIQPIKPFNAPFEKDLYFGMSGDQEVVRLQDFLRGSGYFTYPESTGNYFTITLDAVKKFQKAQGLPPIGGYFGPQSRAAANKFLSVTGSGGATTGSTLGGSATTSPYKGKITIGNVSGSSATPEYESVTIDNRDDKEKINITGFSIENSRRERFIIPMGHELPGFYASPQDPIMLKPGDRAVITVGRQGWRMDFRENLCTGYFDETSSFIPSLSHKCPRHDTRRLLYLSDRCIRAIDSTSSCRQMRTPIDSDCSQYVNENLNYAGCARNYRARSDFYSNRWLVWMQRRDEFFRNTHEKVVLRDQQGRMVDEYSY